MTIIVSSVSGNAGYTFLQLVQRLRSEAGVSGADPVTCQNQSGELLRLVRWINDAWLDIQNKRADWFFLRSQFSFQTNTASNQQSYTPIQCNTTNFGNWKRDSLRIYTTSLGFANEMILPFAPYDAFRNLYLYGANRSNYMRPSLYSIDPQKNIVLGGPPDLVGYTINGEYYAVATYLQNDTDIPVLPPQYQMAIVWRALMWYGQYEGAAEAAERGTAEFRALMLKMEKDQLPTIGFGEPLA
jgi:hypothetical protein